MCTRNKKEGNAPVANAAEKKFHFEKLAPIDTADIDVYEEAIDFTFENDDIRNIAISGAYGSGKSSLLASYKKKHPDKAFIHISLAHFEPDHKEEYQVKLDKTPQKTSCKASEESEEGQNPSQGDPHYKPSESILEGKILNQLIHQLNAEDIPQTNFRVMLTIIYGVEDANDIRHKNYSSIVSKPDATLAQYIDRDIDMYADAMLDFCEHDIQDYEKDAIVFLNHPGISIEQKQQYIRKLKTKISQLGIIEYTSLWANLLECCVVEFSEDNIVEYWSNSKDFDSYLTSFVNNSQRKVDLSSVQKKFEDGIRSELFNQIVKCKNLNNDKYIDMLTSMNRSYQRRFEITGIPDDKMELLIDAGIIYMTADILKSIRQNYPNVLYRFIEKNIEDYVDIMTTQLLVHDEVLEILSWAVDDELKLTLLKLSSAPISVVDKEYSTTITLYILQKRIDTTDMQTLCVKYPKLAEEINAFVVSYAEPRIDSIINGTLKSSDNLKLRMLSSTKVNESNKYKLLHTMLARVNKQWGKACFEHLHLSEFVKIFDSHAKPKIPKNDQNKKILDTLVSRGWIFDYPNYPYDSNYYTVRRNAPSKKRELTKV